MSDCLEKFSMIGGPGVSPETWVEGVPRTCTAVSGSPYTVLDNSGPGFRPVRTKRRAGTPANFHHLPVGCRTRHGSGEEFKAEGAGAPASPAPRLLFIWGGENTGHIQYCKYTLIN